jgi:uncharacterized protein YjbJ (UPF0337 family)
MEPEPTLRERVHKLRRRRSARISAGWPRMKKHETDRSTHMNWEQIQGNWKQISGKLRETWGRLTDDDFDRIAGKRDQLIGAIQQRYGIAKEEAEKQVRRFEETIH